MILRSGEDKILILTTLEWKDIYFFNHITHVYIYVLIKCHHTGRA